MTVTIIGLGLIGGSIAKRMQVSGFSKRIIGVDNNESHRREALSLGLVDKVSSMDEAISNSELIVLAIPVNAAREVLSRILDLINENTVVIDMGSTKAGICQIADQHRKRHCFVASHPIAGTENSGPQAALDNLFDGKIGIICDAEKSSKRAIDIAERLYAILAMKLTKMGAEEHDLHIAYVSHLSHVSSFMLGVTVLEKERDEENIFNMAGSGFESTVRLAKSSPDMWRPIFDQNSERLSEAVGAYIDNLQLFKKLIDEKNFDRIYHLMNYANEIRRVLDGISLMTKKEEEPPINQT